MRGMTALGLYDTPEFRSLWSESEAIKNQTGGMPPLPRLRPITTPLLKLRFTPAELRILGRSQ